MPSRTVGPTGALYAIIGEVHRSEPFRIGGQGAEAELRLYLKAAIGDVATATVRRGEPGQAGEPVKSVSIRMRRGLPLALAEERTSTSFFLEPGTYHLEVRGSAPFPGSTAIATIEWREVGRLIPPIEDIPVLGDVLRALEQFVRSPLFVPGAIVLAGLYIYSRAPAERRERIEEGARAVGRVAAGVGRTVGEAALVAVRRGR